MEDRLDGDERPDNPTRLVVCLDEASKELHDAPRGSLPVQPGQPLRRDDASERRGGANLLLAIEPLRGWRTVRVTERAPGVTLPNRGACGQTKMILRPNVSCWSLPT